MFSRVLHVCHKVFFHQINAWVVHGSLVDVCEEFFINKFENQSSGPAKGQAQFDDTKSQLNATAISGISTNPATANLVSTILSMSPENDEIDSEKDDW